MDTVAVIGSGLVGRGWAIVCARGGHKVNVYDISREAGVVASREIESSIAELVETGLVTSLEADQIFYRIKFHSSLQETLAGVTYVQECVKEELSSKISAIREIFDRASQECIVASSTSAIMPTSIAEGLPDVCRERFLVAHPVNPPYLVPFTEVVPSVYTAQRVVDETYTFLKRCGQAAIVLKKEIAGFVLNRLQIALVNEAISLFNDGIAGVQELDLAVSQGLGYRWSFMGPFETIDLNAPGGIKDYLQRFEEMYSLAATMRPMSPFSPALLELLEVERRKLLTQDELSTKTRWRDHKLMKFRKYMTDGDA